MRRGAITERNFEYIEVDYDRYRRHSTIGFIGPERFEAEMYVN
ncbi:hypothetical protein [Cellvibrio fibrivorans]|uniref:Integrase catalytic domain-containing protein n=1 Tax=Cellvibrio fibrivorans TaxID=126350 RepID=A0ABU1UXG3_9GAMM|nr:hypothetical protein [Cellvibrio fibrivorans]MDR7089812.1 hypothetical protein [Cellvibrio fibrivorans]